MSASSAQRWDAQVAAFEEQLARLSEIADIQVANAVAQRFDPHRDFDGPLAATASYVEPNDVVLDVGGGAGRIALPLALRCRQVINVDPSPAMKDAFEGCAKEAGITNVKFVLSDWLRAEEIEGDVALVIYSIELVRDIVPFIRKLEGAAGRRVVITSFAFPPTERGTVSRRVEAELFQKLHGEEPAELPQAFNLLDVLWEMGILPEVRLQRVASWSFLYNGYQTPRTPEDAIQGLVWRASFLRPESSEQARKFIAERFDELFVQTPEGFRRPEEVDGRDILITWETSQR